MSTLTDCARLAHFICSEITLRSGFFVDAYETSGFHRDLSIVDQS